MHTRRTRRTILSALLLLALPAPGVTACADEPAAAPAPAQPRAATPDELADLAVSADPAAAADARARLRAAGPAGLATFLARHAPAPSRPELASPGALARLVYMSQRTADDRVAEALDEICAQKDCAASHLYWYTDLEAAREAARASGKPILSLRLLGDLTDELSCANSRFFRALLYPDPAVGALLREQFVLHWQSERPAPKITIDLGDGRTVVSTITGNSVHYVLDAAGRPVDALPGLLAPAVFADGLRRAGALARATAGLDGEPFAEAVRRHHEARVGALARAWDEEMRAIGQPARMLPQPRLALDDEPAPRAGRAAPISLGKMAVEAPMLRRLGEPVEDLSEAALFERLADRQEPTIAFSEASLAVMRRQQWRSGDPARDAADFARALAALRRAVALDTLRNEYDLHKQIHQRFLAAPAQAQEPLNRWLYSELFLTPRSDPWLGLAAPTIYSGLPGGGRRVEARI